MDILAHARRRAFSLWLRTGRLPRWAKTGTTELKYNPWHDPDDGRFTFAGTGRYFGRGSTGSAARRSVDARMSSRAKEPFGGYAGGGDGFNGGGGSSGSFELPDEAARRAQDNTGPAQPIPTRSPQATLDAYARLYRQSVDNPRNWRRVAANGYIYRIDALGRTRRVTGKLTENRTQSRSPAAQAQAGGPDRRRSDHGGHYIARRFNGPTDAFNHFAQDANFNRSDYSRLENLWARALRNGSKVEVDIQPVYRGTSRRPSTIRVSYWIDGFKRSARFPNEPRERSGARS